jgi:hypothetical protein
MRKVKLINWINWNRCFRTPRTTGKYRFWGYEYKKYITCLDRQVTLTFFESVQENCIFAMVVDKIYNILNKEQILKNLLYLILQIGWNCVPYLSIIQDNLRGITIPTEQKMQPTTHRNKRPDIEAVNVRVFLLMSCGLHFLFHRAHCSS